MIKILATSDWHLGNTFHGFDRLEEQAHFLDWLIGKVEVEQPDVLLVAGDVFDTSNPSAAAQELYYTFLDTLSLRFPALHTVIIAGNHDSAARLEAPRSMLERHRVYVRGIVHRTSDGGVDYDNLLIPLHAVGRPEERVWIMAVPYLRDGDFERGLSYSEGVADFLNKLMDEVQKRKSPKEGLVLMGHLYATGAEIEEGSSERVVIGGTEMVDLEQVDESVTFAVLGHLHRRQHVGKRENWMYPGSALPMSFTERNYSHGVLCLKLENGEVMEPPAWLDYQLLYPLLSVPHKPAPVEEVLGLLAQMPGEKEEQDSAVPYLEVNILLDTPVAGISKLVEDALDRKKVRLCRITTTYRVKVEQQDSYTMESVDDLLTRNPLEVIRKSYLNKHKCEMREELLVLANKAIEAARKEDEE